MEYIIVQAGGKGTRLGYLTKNKPKALVPVENLPMIFYLFRKYPGKRFLIIADYKKEVLREYLSVFADVKYQVVDAQGTGTCSGIGKAMARIPDGEPFMLVWSDLILPEEFKLPENYGSEKNGVCRDYIGISETFPCRWKYEKGTFTEEGSIEHGVGGLFLFSEKRKLKDVPESGEFVRWLQQKGMKFQTISLAGAREWGLLEEYEKLEQVKCRPFNRITIDKDRLIKEPIDTQGEKLAVRESAWYDKARQLGIKELPRIYKTRPLNMEYIEGKNVYECQMSYAEKKKVLTSLVNALKRLHGSGRIPADSFSMKEAYFNKTMERLGKIEDLVPFGRERSIWINGKECRNIYFYKRELEKKLETLTCETFRFIHGDCTFSNLMIRRDKSPVLIDPRGYFGFTELYGDVFTVLKAGLYERACGIGFCEYGAHSSRFTEADSGSWVDAVKLDDVAANEKVSFIKFDLEGADIPALKGSEQTIKRWKPKLALSIYHNIEDLWEIPLMVKRMLPEYRLFVRHHTIFLWDKILYAAIEEDLAQ